MTLEETRAAVADFQRAPQAFGPCVRAMRGLHDTGHAAKARELGRAYGRSLGAPEGAGDALATLIFDAPAQRVGPGVTLIDEGASGQTLMVLLSGQADVKRLGVGELAQLAPGAVIGEVAPLTGVHRTATVFARLPSEVLVFEQAALEVFAERLPTVFESLRAMGRERMLAQLMGPSSIFGGLDAGQRDALYAQCLPATIPDGTRLIREGHAGSAMCIIASGHADVWQRAGGGRRKTLVTLGPGDVFGEIALLGGRVASANVEAVSPLTIFALDREGFAAALDAHPETRRRVERLAADRLGADALAGDEPLPVVRVQRTLPPG